MVGALESLLEFTHFISIIVSIGNGLRQFSWAEPHIDRFDCPSKVAFASTADWRLGGQLKVYRAWAAESVPARAL